MNLIDALENMNAFLNQSYYFRGFKFLLAFYLIVIILFVAGAVYRMWGDGYYKALFTGAGYKPKLGKYQSKWIKVNKQAESDDPSQRKAAVLECAQMLNEMLKAIGYGGDNLGERLENLLPSQIDNIEKLKVVNEVKNKIVQDPDFEVSKEESTMIKNVVGRTLDTFEVIEIDE